MYPFITHTWNTVKGKCPHDCEYCYMKRFKQNPVRFDKTELKTDLGEANFIFVGSSCDMWADEIPYEWIYKTLDHCKFLQANKNNRFLFQTKNPKKYFLFENEFPMNTILGVTIESDKRYDCMGNTPDPADRASDMNLLANRGWKTMVTVEPCLAFEPLELWNLICMCKPEWVNIGADSRSHNLPEPDRNNINQLIYYLRYEGIIVKIKDNLKRIIGSQVYEGISK